MAKRKARSKSTVPQEKMKPPEAIRPLGADPLQTLGLVACCKVVLSSDDLKRLAAQFQVSEQQILTDFSTAVAQFVAGLNPGDKLQKLALEHLVVHHVRTVSLARLAAVASEPERIKILNDACDGASGSFRRLLCLFR